MLPSIDLCRFCGQKKKLKRQIFEIQDLPEMIKYSLDLDITMTGPLPKVICYECQKSVEQYYAFKKKCVDTQLMLIEIAHGQASVKKLATIKQELESADEPPTVATDNDHTYSVNTPNIRIVKTEARDEGPPLQKSDTISVQDFSFGDLINEIPLPEVKQLIVDLANNDEENLSETEFYETKPACEFVASLEPEMFLEEPIQEIEKTVEEYSNEDLMLKDGETYEIDMEQIEAECKKSRNPNIRLKCKVCKKSFKFYKGLRKHKAVHEIPEKIYTCHFCIEETQIEFQFASLTTLKRHLFTQHFQNGKYQCKICLQYFKTKILYKMHLSAEHAIKSCACHICGKECCSRNSLNGHMRLHNGMKPYTCTKCGKKFKWLSSLQWHLRSHEKQKDFLCSQCGLRLSSRTALIEHLNIHSGEKPFSCLKCEQSFSHRVSLKRHETRHEEPKYKCMTCDISFSQQRLLKEHQLVHTGKRPIICKICNTQFQRISCYSRHARVHKTKNFKCEFCDYVCHRADALAGHMVRHSGIRHLCPAQGCFQSYTQRTPLMKHFKKTHPEFEMLGRKNANKEAIEYDYRSKF